MHKNFLVFVDEIEQGKPIHENAAEMEIPREFMEDGELVYRFRAAYPYQGIEPFDVLIVAPRRRVNTGELVIATLDGVAYLGHWWAKNGTRQLMEDGPRQIVSGNLRIKGVVNVILRGVTTE